MADPGTPQRLFVGGHQAVSASTDGGATWHEVDSLRDADAMGWAFSPDAVFVTGHPGLNRSDDGGKTFHRDNHGLPGTDIHAFGAGRDVLYGSAVDGGFFRSADAGKTWQSTAARGTESFFGRIIVDPQDDHHLLAADAARGAAESTDGGDSWRTLGSGLEGATWLSRGPSGSLIASGPAGAARSTDNGRTWAPLEPPPGATLIEISPDGDNTLYAGIHDNTTVRVVVSHDAGTSWNAP